MAVLWTRHTGLLARGQGVQGEELGEKQSIAGCFCREPGSISDDGGPSVSLALGPAASGPGHGWKNGLLLPVHELLLTSKHGHDV